MLRAVPVLRASLLDGYGSIPDGWVGRLWGSHSRCDRYCVQNLNATQGHSILEVDGIGILGVWSDVDIWRHLNGFRIDLCVHRNN